MKKTIEYFSKIAYKYYPKGIDYFDSNYKINSNYINSYENIKFEKLKSTNFGKSLNFGQELITLIQKSSNKEIEFRDITNLHMGDKAFNIQNSSFFYKKKLKYYPVCFVFSGIIPFYSYYIIDIDVDFNHPLKLGSYNWKKNNGSLSNLEDNSEILSLTNEVRNIIEKDTDFKMFPMEILSDIIPDACNETKNFGSFSFFNAFFMDNYYCLP